MTRATAKANRASLSTDGCSKVELKAQGTSGGLTLRTSREGLLQDYRAWGGKLRGNSAIVIVVRSILERVCDGARSGIRY
jgi:hypothetical protein